MKKHCLVPGIAAALFLGVSPSRLHGLRELRSEDVQTGAQPPVTISGHVVDDATGDPIANFAIQGGHVDEKDPATITWGYTLET